MAQKQKLAEEVEMVETLKTLAEAYEEISIIRMQRIKDSVLKTHQFFSRLSNLFVELKNTHKEQLLALLKVKKIKKNINFNLLPKKKNTVYVFISANNRFYGGIIREIFNLFIQDITKSNADIIIVGRVGKELFEQKKLNRKYSFVEIPDYDVTFDNLKPLISTLIDYQKVKVYYGRFVNLITQTATSSDVSGEQPFEQTQKVSNKKYKYVFEPNIDMLLQFFESQIFTSLFQQTVHDSQLARFASRIQAMEKALVNIEDKRQDLYSAQRRDKNRILNKKQQSTISGISLWGGGL